MDNYYVEELARVLKENENEPSVRMQIAGQNTKTKWLDIPKSLVEALIQLHPKDPKDFIVRLTKTAGWNEIRMSTATKEEAIEEASKLYNRGMRWDAEEAIAEASEPQPRNAMGC